MRAVAQRVSRARVTVDGQVSGEVGPGLLVLVSVAPSDGEREVGWMARKLSNLRIFPDEDGLMNRSLLDVGGGALLVSQFTLHGDCRKGNRPSFIGAAAPDVAEPLYERLCQALVERGVPVSTGVFGAMMEVELVNQGPVTMILETP